MQKRDQITKVGGFDLMGNLSLFSLWVVFFFLFQLKAEVECVMFPQMWWAGHTNHTMDGTNMAKGPTQGMHRNLQCSTTGDYTNW